MQSSTNRFNADANLGDTFILTTRAEIFEQNIIKSDKPVLLLCIHRGTEWEGQLSSIKQLSQLVGDAVKIYMLAEEFIPAFMDRFQVTGTPTFFIFNKGEEKGRLLGQADIPMLTQFLSKYLNLLISTGN
jgi:hypothetical protein